MWEFSPSPSKPILMGVLNVTPDSFSDGGQYLSVSKAVRRAHEMAEEGAGILDIGGESSRPGSKPVSAREEIQRIRPVLKKLVGKIKIPISVDTYKEDVALAALDEGAVIVNDITALADKPRLARRIASYKAGVILMHMSGNPQTMQAAPRYKNVVQEIFGYLKRRAAYALDAGIRRDRIAVDPGFGFGKSYRHNLQLLAGLNELLRLKLTLAVGLSNKSFIGTLTGVTNPADRLAGSLAAAMIAVQKGAEIIRVHNVIAHRQMLRVMSEF